MGEILSQVFTLPVRVGLIIFAVILVLLWIVAVIWVNRDARLREAPVGFWTIFAIVPVAGIVAYCLLRPPLNTADSAEQTMSIELMGRQLANYGNCPKCGRPVEKDFIACPHCRTKLRNICGTCGKPLEPDWRVCPYCATGVARPARRSKR
jgi:RNA polymerase subunit RPABC4/transcription elongation factor Spt4